MLEKITPSEIKETQPLNRIEFNIPPALIEQADNLREALEKRGIQHNIEETTLGSAKAYSVEVNGDIELIEEKEIDPEEGKINSYYEVKGGKYQKAKEAYEAGIGKGEVSPYETRDNVMFIGVAGETGDVFNWGDILVGKEVGGKTEVIAIIDSQVGSSRIIISE